MTNLGGLQMEGILELPGIFRECSVGAFVTYILNAYIVCTVLTPPPSFLLESHAGINTICQGKDRTASLGVFLMRQTIRSMMFSFAKRSLLQFSMPTIPRLILGGMLARRSIKMELN